jgi:hypothetical protein
MLRITSRKDGTDPVVIAFRRGIVTVGDPAYAVKGTAEPDRIRLSGRSMSVQHNPLESSQTFE